MFKFNHGITLISLIITIIIMLVLAGVTVSLIIGDNGLFTKANSGSKLYKERSDEELSNLESIADSIDETPQGSIETPILSSNSDKVICSSEQTGWEAWKVFDDKFDKDTAWFANGSQNQYVGYDFTDKVKVTRIELVNSTYSGDSDFRINQIQVIGSNDNINFTPISDIINIKKDLSVQEFNINTNNKYRYIAVKCFSDSQTNVSLRELKIYSNSNNHITYKTETPFLVQNSDRVISSSEQSGWPAWRVFDNLYEQDNAWFTTSTKEGYVGYDFSAPTLVTRIELVNSRYSGDSDFRVEQIQVIGSNDNVNFTPITDVLNIKKDFSVQEFNINTTDKYRYIAVKCFSQGTKTISLVELKIYSNSDNHIKLNKILKTPTLSGPSSKLTVSNEQSASYPAWKMFDGKINRDDAWYTSTLEPSYFIYNFDYPVKIKSINVANGYWNATDNYRVKTITLYGSNDNSSWTQIGNEIPLAKKAGMQAFDINATESYQYIKVLCTDNFTATYPISLQEFEFYYQ